jgi:phosphate uptake regulator
MAALASELYRTALDAWSAQALDLACSLVDRSREMDERYGRLVEELLTVQGADGPRIAIVGVVMGRALGRIADHTVIVGERLRYLLTGDPAYLASEIR